MLSSNTHTHLHVQTHPCWHVLLAQWAINVFTTFSYTLPPLSSPSVPSLFRHLAQTNLRRSDNTGVDRTSPDQWDLVYVISSHYDYANLPIVNWDWISWIFYLAVTDIKMAELSPFHKEEVLNRCFFPS